MVRKLFEKMGEFLVDAFKLDQPGKGKSGIQQELLSLSSEGKAAVRNYYIRKCSVLLAVLVGGGILSSAGLIVYLADPGETETETLVRPGYGEGDRKEELTVQVEGEEEERRLEVTVQERKYTDKEKEELLEEALQELENTLLGANRSADEVRSDLNFPASLKEGAVKASWLTVPYGIIGEDGTIQKAEEEEGTLVKLQATLTCSGRERIYESYVRVFPPILSEQEQFRQTLQKEVEQADADGSHSETMELPRQVDGRQVTWSRESENPFPSLLALTVILTVCVYLEMDSMVHKRAELRKNQLMLDYPDLMWKMTMLLGAGLSIKGVFTRISEEYLRQQGAARDGWGIQRAQADAGKRPVGTGERSAGTGERPAGIGKKLAGTGERLAGTGERSAGTGERSAGTGKKPVGTGGKPAAAWTGTGGTFAENPVDLCGKTAGKPVILWTARGRERKVRYVYEEVTSACYEMQSGISEAQAYERFGKRCQLPEYIRLGSILSQNLKKGSKGLTGLLEQEAETSMNDRKNHARKIGEQAGTKLLLPMVLMLGIVLVILMVPAFLSF